jgi:hypothetical protein
MFLHLEHEVDCHPVKVKILSVEAWELNTVLHHNIVLSNIPTEK